MPPSPSTRTSPGMGHLAQRIPPFLPLLAEPDCPSSDGCRQRHGSHTRQGHHPRWVQQVHTCLPTLIQRHFAERPPPPSCALPTSCCHLSSALQQWQQRGAQLHCNSTVPASPRKQLRSDSLHAVHAGDLKPDNILLIAEAGHPAGARALITDFGLCAALEEGQTHGGSLPTL